VSSRDSGYESLDWNLALGGEAENLGQTLTKQACHADRQCEEKWLGQRGGERGKEQGDLEKLVTGLISGANKN